MKSHILQFRIKRLKGNVVIHSMSSFLAFLQLAFTPVDKALFLLYLVSRNYDISKEVRS